MTNSCFEKIHSYYGRFSEKEKKVANYILDTPDKIIHRTINEVAEDLNVAEATVFRFCKRIGLKGYKEMKIALASEIINPFRQNRKEITKNDNQKRISEMVFRSNIRTLENTLQMIEIDSIQKAVELVRNADRVEFYGTEGSAFIAMVAQLMFMEIGIKASAFMDFHFQLMSALQLTKNDVAVVISHSGITKDAINILNTAKKSGAKTIGITSFPESAISKFVDAALYTCPDEIKYRSEALATHIAQLSFIDAIYVNLMRVK